jgi:hypothetical protein
MWFDRHGRGVVRGGSRASKQASRNVFRWKGAGNWELQQQRRTWRRITGNLKRNNSPGGRQASKRRRTPKESGGAGVVRYFLTKATSNGTPELDQEMPDENQARIAALKQDRSFVTVKEWRAKVDIKKGEPVIGKDPVLRE